MRSIVLGALAAFALAVPARADLRPSYSLGPTIFGGANDSSVRGVAVNNNKGGDYEGFVYVTDTGSGAGNNLRRIQIFRPDPLADRSGATSYVNTGWTVSIPGADQLAPFGVFVDGADTIWLADYGARKIYTSPHPDADNPTITNPTLQITMSAFDAAAKADLQASGGSEAAVPGNPRNLWVVGTPVAATVLTANFAGAATNSAVQSFDVSGGTATSAGTATHNWSRYLGLGAGPYGVTADNNGNVYVALSPGSAGGNAIRKYDAEGVLDVGFSAPLPAGVTGSVVADVSFVPDPDNSDGGYLVQSGRFGSANGANVVLRYDLNGVFLEGYGPAAAGAPNYTTLTLTGSTPSYTAVDNAGNVFQRTIFGSNSGVRKVFRLVPFVAAAGATASTGSVVKSSPTVVDGVVYYGASDGKLYANTVADGMPVSNFPVDISAAVGTPVQLLGRPAVYYTSSGKAIYLTTNRGDVVKVLPDSTVAWTYSGRAYLNVNTATAPAVTFDGFVYAAISGSQGAQVIKLSDADGSLLLESPSLAADSGSISSPAVEQGGARVYVGTQGGGTGDLWQIDGASMTVLTAFAKDQGVTAPPHVKGPFAYVGTLAGKLYKINSANSTVDASFGTAGAAEIGEPLVTDAFPMDDSLYVGSGAGKVWTVSIADGAFSVLYNTQTSSPVGGLVVNRDTGTVAFGTHAGKFYLVPVSGVGHQPVFGGYGPISTTPSVSRTANQYLVGSEDGNVYVFNGLEAPLAS